MSRTEQIAMPDGGQMGAYVAVPKVRGGAGMLVLMEIFGVTGYIREVADRLAALGYVALAPDLYRRTDPGLELAHDEESLPAAFQAAQKLDHEGAVEDAITAMYHLQNLPQTTGPAGVLGFCLGGTLAYGVATHGDPATAVAYYGSGIADQLSDADKIACPVLFQFGAEDPYIPREHADRVASVARERPGWEAHIQPDGGHAFDNWDAPMFSAPEAAKRAWIQTTAFLRNTLPVV